jgi:uncharacterized membrane protein YozB (DUF420 family)
MIELADLPALNASLNAAAAVCLVVGYYWIRRRRVAIHKRFMAAALGFSGLFLTSYLIYHFQVGSVAFTGTGWVRPVYFAILLSHIVLAATVLPLAVVTVYRAWNERFESHKRLARWTLPIWLYVSVTGVIIYWMLYH